MVPSNGICPAVTDQTYRGFWARSGPQKPWISYHEFGLKIHIPIPKSQPALNFLGDRAYLPLTSPYDRLDSCLLSQRLAKPPTVHIVGTRHHETGCCILHFGCIFDGIGRLLSVQQSGRINNCSNPNNRASGDGYKHNSSYRDNTAISHSAAHGRRYAPSHAATGTQHFSTTYSHPSANRNGYTNSNSNADGDASPNCYSSTDGDACSPSARCHGDQSGWRNCAEHHTTGPIHQPGCLIHPIGPDTMAAS